MPRFGSYKYSVQRLVEKGILLNIQNGRHAEKLHLTISSDDVGVFIMDLTSSQHNEDIHSGSEEIKLEDLLQLQYSPVPLLEFVIDDVCRYNSVQTVKMMKGVLELHVDRLIQYIYRKFYQT
jgi:Ras GTPase-activating-like protein IQGAP2/3